MKYRMYHLVMYNISPIQQGIQAYHAGMEYANKWSHTEEFKQWINVDKTVIILNGGTSNSNAFSEHYGTMDKYLQEIFNNNIYHGAFREPDLNDALSSIAFLADERVWDKENYCDYIFDDVLRMEEEMNSERYLKWVYLMGGEKNVWLRNFLSQFKLA